MIVRSLMGEMKSGTMVTATNSSPQPENGERRSVDNIEYVFYDGYWIRYYAPIEDTLANRKRLIDSLTRRAFHHTEPCSIALPICLPRSSIWRNSEFRLAIATN